MIGPEMVESLRRQLFSDPTASVFAILDGAAIPDLLDALYEQEPEHCCLYRGDLEPDLAETAPYLVRLDPRSRFTEWLLAQGWGRDWGIFAIANADLKTMQRHFRRFLLVEDEDGNSLYFAYYDPRVLRIYLPTCNSEEITVVFGPVLSYFCEGPDGNSILRFSAATNGLATETVPLIDGLSPESR